MRDPESMDQAVRAVLEEYEARARREEKLWSTLSAEESMRRRDELLLPVGRAAGTLMNLLVKEGEARRILEVGSSYGYSTTWLAEAARAVGGKVASLGQLAGPFDFVLIDLWKNLYVPVFELLHPKLAQGAIIVADNMLQPESARAHARAYRQRVGAAADMSSVLLAVGNGLEV